MNPTNKPTCPKCGSDNLRVQSYRYAQNEDGPLVWETCCGCGGAQIFTPAQAKIRYGELVEAKRGRDDNR